MTGLSNAPTLDYCTVHILANNMNLLMTLRLLSGWETVPMTLSTLFGCSAHTSVCVFWERKHMSMSELSTRSPNV
jgi:hypothetical protein